MCCSLIVCKPANPRTMPVSQQGRSLLNLNPCTDECVSWMTVRPVGQGLPIWIKPDEMATELCHALFEEPISMHGYNTAELITRQHRLVSKCTFQHTITLNTTGINILSPWYMNESPDALICHCQTCPCAYNDIGLCSWYLSPVWQMAWPSLYMMN